MRRQVFYLIDAGLNLEAAELGRTYIARANGKAEDYIAIGTALRRGGSLDEALHFLESARLRFPGNVGIAKALAQHWLGKGDPLAPAENTEGHRVGQGCVRTGRYEWAQG